jgi:hypothetical protein
VLLTGQQASAGSAQRFAATCSAAEAVGDFVRVTAANTVATVDIDAATTHRAIGVIVAKPSPTSCVVQRSGTVTLAGLIAGALYFVGTSGAAGGFPGSPASGRRTIQIVGTARTATLLDLHIDPSVFRVLP